MRKTDAAALLAEGAAWIVGFMSGTSLDGVDAALLRTDGETISAFGPWLSRPFSAQERSVLSEAVEAALAWRWDGPSPECFGRAAETLVRAHGDAFEELMRRARGISPVMAGFHGQTVLHQPPAEGRMGRTLQLGDARALAARLGVPVVYDLRQSDIRAGGHGAPLAPVYHRALLGEGEGWRFAVNIGGVANITACGPSGRLIAFDSGPGNGPIDEWISEHGLGEFDIGGETALRGAVDANRLERWLSAPFFAQAAPRSADRRQFRADLATGLSLEDGAASLAALTAESIIRSIKAIGVRPEKVVVMGGGRRNRAIMNRLREAFGAALLDADELGWRGDAIEAEAWAYLAARSARGLPINFPNTTGAPRPMSAGEWSAP